MGFYEVFQDEGVATASSACGTEAQTALRCDDTTFLCGLIDGLRCGIVAIDRDGKLTMLNELGTQILGLEVRPLALLKASRRPLDRGFPVLR